MGLGGEGRRPGEWEDDGLGRNLSPPPSVLPIIYIINYVLPDDIITLHSGSGARRGLYLPLFLYDLYDQGARYGGVGAPLFPASRPCHTLSHGSYRITCPCS